MDSATDEDDDEDVTRRFKQGVNDIAGSIQSCTTNNSQSAAGAVIVLLVVILSTPWTIVTKRGGRRGNDSGAFS